MGVEKNLSEQISLCIRECAQLCDVNLSMCACVNTTYLWNRPPGENNLVFWSEFLRECVRRQMFECENVFEGVCEWTSECVWMYVRRESY